MTPTTYRPRAAGPGWKPEEFEAVYLAQAGGDVWRAFRLACVDMSRSTTGGLLRPPLFEGAAELNLDPPEKAL